MTDARSCLGPGPDAADADKHPERARTALDPSMQARGADRALGLQAGVMAVGLIRTGNSREMAVAWVA